MVEALYIVTIAAALLCGLVTGLLFGFAVVAMPGLGTLNDGAFLRGFQVMDRVIQNRQPLFMVAWVGSVLAVVATAVLGIAELDGADLLLALAAAVVYQLGVQVPTAAINIPLNNAIQAIDPETLDAEAQRRARQDFEARWNQWNGIRTAMGVVTTVLLLVLLLRLSP